MIWIIITCIIIYIASIFIVRYDLIKDDCTISNFNFYIFCPGANSILSICILILRSFNFIYDKINISGNIKNNKFVKWFFNIKE